MADNVGLAVSYDAYQIWRRDHVTDDLVLPGLGLTPDQQFFVGFAQVGNTLLLIVSSTVIGFACAYMLYVQKAD